MKRGGTLVVGAPELSRTDDGQIRLNASIADEEPLWFAVESEHAELITPKADAFAVALLLPAMRYQRDLHLGGAVDEVLLHRLNREAQSLVQAMHPNYSRISVSADEARPSAARGRGVATGFSGGVDSLAVLAEYALASGVPEELRITHLLSNNVGAFGDGGRELWSARYRALAPVAEELGLPFVKVDSNLETHFTRMGFLQTHTFRNAAVAHALSAGIGRTYYASAVAYGDAGISSGGEIAYADGFLLPLLSTPSLTIESANPDLSRVEKTLALATNPFRTHLDVCIDPDPQRIGNCSRCWKCVRTMFTLEVAGMLDEFTPVPFRLEPYREARSAFTAEILASDGPLLRELRAFAESRGRRWSAGSRVHALFLRSQRSARQLARAAKQAVRARVS
ncbi:hypothetical protein [Agromyces sp. H66]|uniref:hypothetical protein n=1 Tax=Agromyces sp. H66 TaxID=2529859 RepID=UPI0010AA8F47|nr:hypothetical protein [Agromyces sp. H66]